MSTLQHLYLVCRYGQLLRLITLKKNEKPEINMTVKTWDYQSENADWVFFFLSSSFSCFPSFSLFSASFCFLYWSWRRWSCWRFHFSNIFNCCQRCFRLASNAHWCGVLRQTQTLPQWQTAFFPVSLELFFVLF